MKEFFLVQILRPALDRIISQAAMFFAAAGVATGDLNEFMAALTVVSGVLVDLVVRKIKL